MVGAPQLKGEHHGGNDSSAHHPRSPIRNFARISRVWWQGITAKPAKNHDKAQQATSVAPWWGRSSSVSAPRYSLRPCETLLYVSRTYPYLSIGHWREGDELCVFTIRLPLSREAPRELARKWRPDLAQRVARWLSMAATWRRPSRRRGRSTRRANVSPCRRAISLCRPPAKPW